MATVVFDGTRINAADANTNWHFLDSGSAAVLNTDNSYQGTGSISDKVGQKTVGGIEYDPVAGAVDFSTTQRVALLKVFVLAVGKMVAADRTQNELLRIGSAQTDYQLYYTFEDSTYPAARSWLVQPIDPNLAGFIDSTVGTPSITAIDYFAHGMRPLTNSQGENIYMDAIDFIDHGKGLTATGTAGVFQDFIDLDEGTKGNRWGVALTSEGILYITGTLTFGTSSSLVFFDSNKVVVFPALFTDAGFSGLAIDLQNASTDIDFSSCSFVGTGIETVKQFFDTALDVNGTTEVFTIIAHGYETGDYVQYSDEGGTAPTGLTDLTRYWIQNLTDDTFALHTVRLDAYSDTSRVGVTADSAPGENHSFTREPDNRADLTVTGTSGAFDTDSCIFDTFNTITLTSVATLIGGFIVRTGKVLPTTATLTGVQFQSPTLEDGTALVTTTTPVSITDCVFNSSDTGHAIELDTTGTFSYSGNTHINYWAPTDLGWNFGSTSGVNGTTEVITTDAVHGFTTGDAVFYNDEGGAASIGLTDATKYYVNVLSTTTVSVHVTESASIADSSRVNLTASGSETHSLYSANAAIYNSSAGLITVNVAGGGDTPSVRNGTGASTTVNNAISLTITGIPGTGAGGGSEALDSEVRIYTTGTTTELDGAENVSTGSFVFSFTGAGNVDIVILNLDFEYFRLVNFTLPASDASQAVVLRRDRNFSNP